MSKPRFTVFTPTYNRAHTLRRAYDSLCHQRHDLFEWLAVDDGSTDGTLALLKELAGSAPFPVRVIRQPNGGKHRAHNAAISAARGDLVVILDSDDELIPGALELLAAEWNRIPQRDRRSFAGILGHSVGPSNEIVGRRYPAEYVDGRQFELVASGIMVGDKLPCYRTDVLRKYPFPERPGCKAYVPEGTVWARIGADYHVRCVDMAVRIYHRDSSDPISITNSGTRPDANAWGVMQYCTVVLNLAAQYMPRYLMHFGKASVNCTRHALHAGVGILHPFSRLDGWLSRLVWAAGVPVGFVVWVRDRAGLRMHGGRD